MSASETASRKSGVRVCLSPEYNKRCACGALLDYSHTYDAEFCRGCDRWCESACRDPACEFCAARPTRPSQSRSLDPAERIPFNPPRIKVAKHSEGARRTHGTVAGPNLNHRHT